MAYANRQEHFRQYVKIAGRGNVEVAWTPTTNKLHLGCRVCDEALTATEPEDVLAIDYSVVEWIKLHAHPGQYVPQKMDATLAQKIAELQSVTPEQKASSIKYFESMKAKRTADDATTQGRYSNAKKVAHALETKTGRKFR